MEQSGDHKKLPLEVFTVLATFLTQRNFFLLLLLFFTFYSNECHCGNNTIIYVGPSQRQPLILSAGILTPTYG